MATEGAGMKSKSKYIEGFDCGYREAKNEHAPLVEAVWPVVARILMQPIKDRATRDHNLVEAYRALTNGGGDGK